MLGILVKCKLKFTNNLKRMQCEYNIKINPNHSGFGGLVVSMLASGTRVRGFELSKPLDFSGVRIILSIPSFAGEVKESVPCLTFAACKRT